MLLVFNVTSSEFYDSEYEEWSTNESALMHSLSRAFPISMRQEVPFKAHLPLLGLQFP